MRLSTIALVFAALGAGTVSVAEAASQSATGCPSGSWTAWQGPNVSISWSFQGIGAVVAFQPGRIAYGGGVAPLNPAQVAGYAPTLNDLRAAAQARRPVTVYWDNATNVVSTFIVRWDQSC